MTWPIIRAEFFKSVHNFNDIPHDYRAQIAFAGRSNVGKSALLNKLCLRKRIADISKAPGKTRSLNFFLINDRIWFVDLPGYGYARVTKSLKKQWGTVVKKYIETAPKLAGVLQLIDSRHPPFPDDLELLEWLAHIGKRRLIVLTKVDKLSHSEFFSSQKMCEQIVTKYLPEKIVAFSATTGVGRDEILKWIESVSRKGESGKVFEN